jgi:leader peptidase (prepilin peptidase)/N-methyltransferase
MAFVIVASILAGLVASRSIVAEADAHRRDGGDRWWSPTCGTCDATLGVTMLVCSGDDHRQRRANGWIIVATAAVFGLVAAAVPSWWVLPAYLWFSYFAILLTVTDLDTKLIPNRILLPGTVGGVVLLVAGGLADGAPGDVARAGASGAIYFTGMVLLALIARGALGFGDVKLAFLLGVFTGYLGWGYLVLGALGAFVLGGVISLLLLVTRRAGRKDSIPFGPFMTTAAVLAVVAGDRIIEWYVG